MSDTINHTLRSTAWARKSLAALILLGVNAVLAPSALALSSYVPADQPVGYVAQERTSSQTLANGNETLYRAEYQRTDWSGNVFAFPISANASVNIGAERWGGEGAQAVIDAQNYSTGRFIATMKDDGTAIPFLYASLSATQQALFLTATIGSTSYTGTQVVNFLRGDRTNENASGMRIRGTVLGDIIHSRLLIVNDATNPTVLVGANDGMLHAIDAADGSERWAYVPSMLLSKMKNLAANPYTHDYYVDGQITVGTVNISGTDKRVLVGGLGAGGKGLYALDITDLAASSDSEVASKVLWEITPTTVNYATPQVYPSTVSATAYQNLGYTYGIPYIRKINNGGTTQTVVIIGNGVNTGGDYQAYLLVIDAATGKLVRSILADTGATTDGTAANPNGLFNPVPIDTDGNGTVDRVYAGDLNGTLWKFDLSSTNVATWSASVLHTTSPAQPITATLDATTHPSGGYMVTFATGSLLTGTYPQYTCTGQPASLAGCTLDAAATGEVADTSVHYVYGIWDGAPVGNTTLKTQILQQRDYIYPPPPTVGGVETEVYRVNATAPVWTAGGDKGWKVPLQICDLTGQPACADIGRNAGGARVIGEGAFISSGRYYVNFYEPTVPYLIPGTDSVVVGENKQLALYFENGGAKELFMDLSGNGTVGSEDRIQYISSDDKVVDGTHDVGESIFDPDQDGIAVGKWLSRGVSSQPLLVKLTTLYTTLFSQNPDISLPPAPKLEQGVTGGHFDSDIYYGSSTSGAKATATIVVGTSGQTPGVAATLGGIAVDGIPIVGPLSIVDIANGTATTTNATMLKNKINADTAISGYTATVSGSTVTVSAPFAGTTYNGKTFTVTDGSESLPATAATGWVNWAPALTTGTFAGGSDGTVTGNTCTSDCTKKKHHHQYDDKYDVTGVNMLNSSDSAQNLSMAIPSASIDFKVLIHNQYLNPAARLHIGDSSYVYNIDHGYINVKDYQTSAGLDITTVPTYNRATIGSLAINLPTDALTTKNWWGNGDMRAGLHPTVTGCVNKADGANDGNMYQPVIPPSNGTDGAGTAGWSGSTTPATATGVRHNGALTTQIIRATTPQTAIEENVAGRPEYGYRVKSANFADYVLAEYTLFWHFGPCYHATPTTQSLSVEFKFRGNKDLSGFSIMIDGAELLVSNNPPSTGKNGLVTWIMANDTTLSGYTVTGSSAKITITKSDGTLPVVEVTADDLTGIKVKRSYTNWTKAPPADTSRCTPIEGATYCKEPAAGSTDPHIGDLSAGVAGDVADVESNTVGNVTTTVITYTDGTSATIVTTHNDDGTVTIVTTDATGTTTTQTVADTAGGSGTSGLLSGSTSGVGRISWRELIRK